MKSHPGLVDKEWGGADYGAMDWQTVWVLPSLFHSPHYPMGKGAVGMFVPEVKPQNYSLGIWAKCQEEEDSQHEADVSKKAPHSWAEAACWVLASTYLQSLLVLFYVQSLHEHMIQARGTWWPRTLAFCFYNVCEEQPKITSNARKISNGNHQKENR